MKEGKEDIKKYFAKVCIFIANDVNTEMWTSDLIKYLLPTLVNGINENNIYVKANCEKALISILKPTEDTDIKKKCLEVLDASDREALNNVVIKVLEKYSLQPQDKKEELDETILT